MTVTMFVTKAREESNLSTRNSMVTKFYGKCHRKVECRTKALPDKSPPCKKVTRRTKALP
jgi:hypothetical protein